MGGAGRWWEENIFLCPPTPGSGALGSIKANVDKALMLRMIANGVVIWVKVKCKRCECESCGFLWLKERLNWQDKECDWHRCEGVRGSRGRPDLPFAFEVGDTEGRKVAMPDCEAEALENCEPCKAPEKGPVGDVAADAKE